MASMREPSGSKGGSKRRAPNAAASDTAATEATSAARRGLLALVATPIGNLGDISERALETLRSADVIACEDTRVTGNLLAKFGIRRPVLPYHDHNAEKMRPQLLERLARGETVALVSDAGTPLISDPGYKLVREAHDAGLAVTAIPGASAPITALVLSGLIVFSSPDSWRRNPAPGARPSPRCATCPRPCCSSRPGRVSPRASPIAIRFSATVRRRSHASSPSCLKRCGAAVSPSCRGIITKAARPRGRSCW
jgi:hypothetical protein